MCGRFARYDDEKDLVERFNFTNPSGILFEKRFNIAPTQTVPVILLENDNRVIKLMRWGLVPFWAKDPTIGNRLINARAETITEKASFKTPLKKNRCLVPASGFYEWKKDERIKTKIPIYFRLKNEEPFAFAGIWDDWKKPEGDKLITFTIITTMANELMKPMHDRMPVILHRTDESKWLDPELIDLDSLVTLLIPYPSDLMKAYEVSMIVNSPKNDSPQCISQLNPK